MSSNARIGQLIRNVTQAKSQLEPTVGGVQAEKTASDTSQPMANYSSERIIKAVNAGKTLDEKLKAYRSLGGSNDTPPTKPAE